LIFVNSISAVRRIAPLLQNLNLPAQALSSNMEQKARLRAMEKFSRTEGAILVATDVAARGLHIPNVSLIVHYHVPRTADMYIHRSGRTARGDDIGTSVVICAPDEVAPFRRLISRLQVQEGTSKTKHKIQDLGLDRRLVGKLKMRVDVAKKIADVGLSKEKNRSDNNIFREAAEDLGVDYDSDELDTSKGKRGRGNMRRVKQKENKEVSNAQVAAWRAELKALLAHRVNAGVSEKYIAQGLVDVDALLRGEKSDFLGHATL
jgi:ATP-dependent RNA helicase DDX24/MAK5